MDARSCQQQFEPAMSGSGLNPERSQMHLFSITCSYLSVPVLLCPRGERSSSDQHQIITAASMDAGPHDYLRDVALGTSIIAVSFKGGLLVVQCAASQAGGAGLTSCMLLYGQATPSSCFVHQ